MTIEHTRVIKGESWGSVVARLCPVGSTQTQRQAFAVKLWATNSANSRTPLYEGQVLHWCTEDLPVVAPPPPPPSTIAHGRDVSAALVGPGAGWQPKTVHTTFQTITGDGHVIEDTAFLAGVRNDGRGTKIHRGRVAQPDPSRPWAFGNYGADTELVDVEVDGREKVQVAVKSDVGGDGLTLMRVWLHSAGHGLNAYTPRKQGPTWHMVDSLIDNIVAPIPVPFEGDQPWHSDAILSNSPSSGAKRCKMLVKLDQTAVVNHGTDESTPAIDGITYADNYYAGGGFAVYHEERGGRITRLVHTGCDFGTDYYPACGAYGMVYPGARPAQAPTWSGNRLVPAGTPVNW